MKARVRTSGILFGGCLASILCCALVLLAGCGATDDASADVTLGETIYVEGTDAQGVPLTHTTEAGVLSRAGCYACHGADGKGRSIDTKLGQFDAPDIRWSVISQPIPNDEGGTDPAYDAALFARAVRVGLDSDGGQLEPVMPRWQLTDPEMNALIAYLQTL